MKLIFDIQYIIYDRWNMIYDILYKDNDGENDYGSKLYIYIYIYTNTTMMIIMMTTVCLYIYIHHNTDHYILS